MTPYYQDDLVTIYHGDSTKVETWEWLWVADSMAIVTDPPYGTGAYAADTDALSPAMLAEWVDCFTVAVFGWPEKLIRLCMAAGRVPDEWIVWWPSNAELKGRFVEVPVARETEHIALFGKLVAARGAPVIGERHHYRGENDRAKHHISPKGKRWGDVWRDPSPGIAFGSRDRLHPNEKPVGLMARLVAMTEGTVLDPFAGSGTTLVAAKALGRPSIGYEINEAHCEIAAQRCAQEVLGLSA